MVLDAWSVDALSTERCHTSTSADVVQDIVVLTSATDPVALIAASLVHVVDAMLALPITNVAWAVVVNALLVASTMEACTALLKVARLFVITSVSNMSGALPDAGTVTRPTLVNAVVGALSSTSVRLPPTSV